MLHFLIGEGESGTLGAYHMRIPALFRAGPSGGPTSPAAVLAARCTIGTLGGELIR